MDFRHSGFAVRRFLLPKVYDGRNGISSFVNYERLQPRRHNAGMFAMVPTEAYRLVVFNSALTRP